MYYENFLNSIKPNTTFIPESASYGDMAIFTERAIQDSYNETIIAIAHEEMAMFESTMYLNELSDDALKKSASTKSKGNILERIKQFFKTIWEKIKGFFTNIITKIKELFTKFKADKGKILEVDFTRALDALPKDWKIDGIAPFDSYKKIYRFAIQNIDIADQNVNEAYAYMKKNLKKFSAQDMDQFNADAVAKKFKRFDSEKDVTFKNWIEAATDNTVKDENGNVKGTKELTASEIKSNKGLIIDVVFNGKDWSTAVKKCYDSSKKNVDKTMERAKQIVNANPDGINAFLAISKQCLSLMTKISGLMTSAMKSIRSNYVSLVSKVVVASKIKLPKRESADLFYESNRISDDVDYFGEASYDYFLEEESGDDDSSDDKGKDSDDAGIDDVDVKESTLYNALVAYMENTI